MRRPRVLLLSPALPPAASGNARQAARLKKHLGSCGFVVRLAAAADPPAALLKTARRFRPDLIWGLHLFKSGPAAARLAKALRIPYGLTVTGTDVNLQLPRASARRRAAVDSAGVIVIPDEAFRNPLLRGLSRDGGSAARIVRIPPGFTTLSGIRRTRGVKTPVILWLGGLRAVKDPGWALASFARVKKKIPAAQLWFAGPLLDQSAAASVLAAARDPGSGVKYLGEKSWPAAQRLIARAAIVTNTSRAEALPHALGEALVQGTPVIARTIPGNRPFLKPRGPGMGVSSPGAWAREVIRILRNPRQPTRRAAIRHFNPAREARDFAALFETLLRGIKL